MVHVKTTRCYDLICCNGRCYCQDVIVVDVITTNCFNILCGRCYCHVADGMATGSVYFNFSSKVLNRTSSHMCGRWYLPMFSVKGWIIDPYVQGFFDSSHEILILKFSIVIL